MIGKLLNPTGEPLTLAQWLEKLENIEPGIYTDIPNDAYHAGPGISKTGLDLFHRSPFHLHAIKSGMFPKPETKSQYIGRAFHAAILEPDVFAREYCLPLRKQDVEIDGLKVLESREEIVALVQAQNEENAAPYADAIRGVEPLVDMVQILNQQRQAKLSATGSKGDLIARLMAEVATGDEEKDQAYYSEFSAMKGAELKEQIDRMNETREGLLPTGGSAAALATLLRENGVNPVLWSEVTAKYLDENGRTLLIGENAPRAELVAWLAANGKKVALWSDIYATWSENNKGRIILQPEEWEKLQHMRRALENHPAASKLLFSKRGGVAEVSIYWRDPETGILLRCRGDWTRNDLLPVDLKTADDASPDGFIRHVANYRYDVSEQMYLAGYEAATGKRPPAMPFVVVENKPPYAVAVYTCGPNFRATGFAQFRADVNRYAECLESGIWPGYPDSVQSIDAPAWHVQRNAHLIDQQETN